MFNPIKKTLIDLNLLFRITFFYALYCCQSVKPHKINEQNLCQKYICKCMIMILRKLDVLAVGNFRKQSCKNAKILCLRKTNLSKVMEYIFFNKSLVIISKGICIVYLPALLTLDSIIYRV